MGTDYREKKDPVASVIDLRCGVHGTKNPVTQHLYDGGGVDNSKELNEEENGKVFKELNLSLLKESEL